MDDPGRFFLAASAGLLDGVQKELETGRFAIDAQDEVSRCMLTRRLRRAEAAGESAMICGEE